MHHCTSVVDTTPKRKKSEISKVLINLFGHLLDKFFPSSSIKDVGSLKLLPLFGKFTADIVDTSPVPTTQAVPVAKFTAVVVDTGVKFARGVPDTSGAP